MISLSDDTKTKFIGEIVFELGLHMLQQAGVIHFLCISGLAQFCLVD